MLEDIRYPIGTFDLKTKVTKALLETWLTQLERAPDELRKAVNGLSEKKLDSPYRLGGWTPRQIVHPIGDSNLNSYIRFKLALTEDAPMIKPYNETEWSKLIDARTLSVGCSLQLLESLHQRWLVLLRSLDMQDLSREFIHPESGRVRLDVNIGAYAWHSRHHTAQILGLRDRMRWR